jgi:hypothetical protein
MNDHDLLLAIQRMLDGEEWQAETLDCIAELLHRNGYRIRDLEPPPEPPSNILPMVRPMRRSKHDG